MADVIYIQSGTAKLCLSVKGEGERLLFIGGTGWDLRKPAGPLNSPLLRQFQVALYDQRGQGRSDKPPAPYTMLDYANDAIAVADALEWDHFHLVGYSFGGMVAQEVAIRHPNRIDRLVLAASTPGGKGGASFPVEQLLDLSPVDRAREGLLIADKRFADQLSHDPETAVNRIKSRAAAQTQFIDEPGAREGLHAQLGARSQHDCYERLDQISAPTLVLAGESDGQAPLDAQMRMAEQIPSASYMTLPGPHDFLFEDDTAYGVIADFLDTGDHKKSISAE
ncbi:alpha/beta fold hydrolase [Cognatishimia activa]|uniref:2-hydroxymuconate semialdehyde hydrolase n=1 Tax=Cognatishimia activa TaxID=1715691 RepID=A0A0P1IRU4_9RHOB|nr:alpha/beta hydrolase [Cognatishimia activa]CUI99988.1 2-hydroxymuconate semialdehyde hydrolase [Cognatishimia activa]CUK26217.1 2-hydroxymuconate semialdehyde hydrolase [Cognatishimia activa]